MTNTNGKLPCVWSDVLDIKQVDTALTKNLHWASKESYHFLKINFLKSTASKLSLDVHKLQYSLLSTSKKRKGFLSEKGENAVK